MKTMFSAILFLCVLSAAACATPSPTVPSPTSTPLPSPSHTRLPTATALASPTRTMTVTRTPTPTPTKSAGERYVSAFGVDYGRPEKYLAQGEQTRLSNPRIIDALRGKQPSLAHLGEIYFWIKREFKTWSAGGATIGVATVDQLFAERRLGGCHDWGLVYASIARELGYPVVMADTLSIAWARQVQSGQKVPYIGHVFVEIFVDGKWIIVDSTNNWYAENNYDPAHPLIRLQGAIAGSNEENAGFYVMRKGVDTRGYGIKSNAELQRLMDESARSLKLDMWQFPPYTFLRFK